jgi:hypothetical protein
MRRRLHPSRPGLCLDGRRLIPPSPDLTRT